MAIKKIVKVWGNSELISDNISFLRMRTKNVFFPLTDTSDQIIEDLIDTYQKIPCAGIAANQIGYDKSIFIGLAKLEENVNVDELEKKEAASNKEPLDKNEYADNYQIYINPQIDNTDASSIQEEIEGCLSIPSVSLKIKRFNKIKVRYYDRKGRAIKKTLKGFMSKLFQHELDHLSGKLMVQHDMIEGFLDEDANISPELFHKLREIFR
jgi:peptide deformylase